METIPDATTTGADAASHPSDVLKALPDSQVFAKDAEDYTLENSEETIARLTKIITRYRNARQDAALIAEQTTKIKKANTAAARKKAKDKPADPFDTKV